MFTDSNKSGMIDKNPLKTEEHYRAFIKQSSEAIWRIELDEPISVNLSIDEQIENFYSYSFLAECNEVMAKMYGFESADKIVGARLGDLLPPKDKNNIEYLRAFINSEYRLEDAESHEVDREGNPKVFLNSLVGIVENGFLTRAWGTQRDITERKEIERSKAHLAAIVESSDDAIVSKDLDGIITSWNKGAEKMFGYSVAEAVGKSVIILIPPYLINEESEIIARIKKGEAVKHYETVRRRKDGTEIDISLTISPIKNDSGKIIGASKIARDITESKRAEESLRESQAILALSMQSSRMGFWTRDLATETVWWSEELEEIFGLPKSSFAGTRKDFLDFVHEDDREEIRRKIQQAIDRHREYTVEFRFWHTDGSLRWMEGRGQAVYSENSEPVRLYGIGIDITERKQAEEELRESEERFAKAFNSSPLVLTITSLKTEKLIEVNETFVRTTGYTREETIGRTTAELGLWTKFADRKAELEAVRKNSEIRDLEYRFRVKDGREIVGLLSAELLEIRGEPCALTVIQDITERKKAAEISERYHLLSMRARDIILFFRPDGQIVDANQMAVETYGYDQSDLLKMRLHDLRAPETLAVLEEQLAKANNGGTHFETVHQRKNGTKFPVEVTSVGADIGGERLLISIIRDISERRQNEEALLKAERRASEEYLELLARIVPIAQTLGTARDLISIYRAVHNFVRASMPCTAFFVSFYDAARRLRTAAYVWGEEGEVDISSLPPMALTKDGGPNSQAIFQKKSVVVNRYWDLMKNRPHIVLQENGFDPNSSLVVPMTVMNRIIGTLEVQAYDENSYTKEHIVALEMVANLAAVAIENVRLLKVEADARETAETANRAKDEFLSVLSHELRTPLNSILGWVRMLRSGMLDKKTAVKAVEVIERNTLLQNNLIEDLLDVSRIISGKMRIEKVLIDLIKVFNDAIEILRPVAAQKNILLEFKTAQNSLMINGDATRLQQIITNLVQNSVKFTSESGNIRVSLARHGNLARLIVRDDGIGIGKEILPFIFERFQQADSSTKRVYSGLGLGLTIVRNLVGLHGGTIKAESGGKEKGATFTVEIPLSEDSPSGKTFSEGESQIVFAENSALSGARILLVDDNIESLVPLQIFLEKEKAEIILANSAKEALEKLAVQDFHVLITDIGMPVADGYELIAKVRQLQTEQNAFITAIALTAYASSDDRRRALAAGFQKHFAKPVDFDEILSVVKAIYEASRK
ncbi:MAG: PAS domain S-box protein [Actinomycetota bacterium]